MKAGRQKLAYVVCFFVSFWPDRQSAPPPPKLFLFEPEDWGGGTIAIHTKASYCFSFSLTEKNGCSFRAKNSEELEGRALRVAQSHLEA